MSRIPLTKTDRAVQFIRDKGVARSDEIEKALALENVAALLATRVLAGDLVTCKVTVPGRPHPLNEYRISSAAGMPRKTTSPWRGDPSGRKSPVPLIRTETTYGTEAPSNQHIISPGMGGTQVAPGSKFVGAIQADVPLPPSRNGNGTLRRTLSQLKVGESFATDYSSKAGYDMARKLGIKVTYRPEGDGIRLWRIE